MYIKSDIALLYFEIYLFYAVFFILFLFYFIFNMGVIQLYFLSFWEQ